MADLRGFTIKLKLIYLSFFIACVTLIGGAIKWQIIYAEEFKNIADSRVYTSELQSLRGSIYSSDGTTLAYSVPVFDMFIWLDDLHYFEEKKIQTREELLQKVSKILETTPEELADIIDEYEDKGEVKWVPIAKDLTDVQWSAIMDLKTDANPEIPLRGFQLQSKSKRLYPEGQLASHLIGIANQEGTEILGRSGLEGYWNARLNPVKGYVIKENNVLGQSVANSLIPTIEPKEGGSLYTSIDKNLQKIIEEKARQGAELYQAEGVNIIIADPKTGKIMAFANYPTYDPNNRKEEKDVYTDKSLTAPFEIGSIGKPLTFAAAIEEGKLKLDDIILPEGHQGCEKYDIPNPRPGEDQVCTWDRKPQPPMTAQDCLIKSDNICLFHIAQRMDHKIFYEYLDKFGIGRPTGVDLFNDDPGYIQDPSQWTISDISTTSFGHGYQATSLQALDALSTIANKGIRMKPYVVEKIVKADGEEIIQKPVVLEEVVSEETAQIVSNAMHQSFLNDIPSWETYYAHLRDYPIAAKSGTALIYDDTIKDYSDKVNSSYVGFDMSPERRFIMLIRLEKPKVGELSFYSVRPLWLDTFNAIKDYIGVKPI